MISSLYIVLLLRKQFQWGADLRASVARCRANGPNGGLCRCAIDVTAVPRKQIVHLVDTGHGNVKSIRLCRGRNTAPFDDPGGENLYLFIDRKLRVSLRSLQSALCCFDIPSGRFSDNQFGREQLLLRAFLGPPLACDLLPSCRAYVPTWARRQVADDGSLNVYGLHVTFILLVCVHSGNLFVLFTGLLHVRGPCQRLWSAPARRQARRLERVSWGGPTSPTAAPPPGTHCASSGFRLP